MNEVTDPVTSRTILIVDDEPDDRALIRRLLARREREYEVIEAETGEDGLARTLSDVPDCVLLDFHLPDMDGAEFLERLGRSTPGGAPVPIAVLTGQEDDRKATAALERGAQDYLVKDGLGGPMLARAIENSIEKFRIRQELVESRIAVDLRNYKLGLLRDELQEKVDQLAEATQAKDQFMAVMSHEMRTPLNAIIGYADLLHMNLDGELTGGQREKVERIQVGSRHLLDLINDVLDLARADANKLELDLRPVDARAVVEEVTALLERQADEKEIRLVVEPTTPSLPHVVADLNRLRQILTNLIGNAIKFTEEGTVRVRCEAREGKTIAIEVIDSGIGIEPEILPLVFSEFFQANSELTREKGGSGLGLAISKRLAHLMGGDIHARSTLGDGSTFTLALPVAPEGSELRVEDVERQTAGSSMRSASAESKPDRAVHVIAFADSADALTELERYVHPGVKLVWTTKADAVPELAIRESAALVVLDIGASDGGSWRAAQAIQETPELSRTAILLLPSIPAGTSGDEAGEGLGLGWLSLVPKPFTAAQLTRAVSTAARRVDGSTTPERADRSYDVLVVDDDPDSRRVAATFLSRAEQNVREAPDGESALREMRRAAPDVVVLDLMMPVLDGFGVLAAMQADPNLAGIPVVVLTAKSLTTAERQFLTRTAVRVLQKGEHRLGDVATLVIRAATRTSQQESQTTASDPGEGPAPPGAG